MVKSFRPFRAFFGDRAPCSCEVIGHRGASFDAPENTLAAVHLAWKQRADAVEVDVRATRDGRLVAIHDPGTRRVCGRAFRVRDCGWARLKRLDVGAWKGERWRGERLAELREILDAVPAGKRLYLELKGGPITVPSLRKILKTAPISHSQLVIISFSIRTLLAVKRHVPDYPTFWITSFRRTAGGGSWLPTPELLLRTAVEAKVDGLDLKAEPEVITRRLVERIHRRTLKVCVWTVDDKALGKQMWEAGVDGITTNRPGWLRRAIVDWGRAEAPQ